MVRTTVFGTHILHAVATVFLVRGYNINGDLGVLSFEFWDVFNSNWEWDAVEI